MSTSSQQTTYSITSTDSSDTITLSIPDISLYSSADTLSTFTTSFGAAQPVYTVSGSSIDTITITNTTGAFNWKLPEEWVDTFPAWSRVEDMCKQYPGLKVAFENFKTVYQLVKDDYDNPKDEK